MDTKLDLEDEIEFQKTEWKIQRIGWFVLSLFLAAGALGFFGGGPFSTKQTQDGSLNIEFDQFSRIQRPSTLKIHFRANQNEKVQFLISQDFLGDIVLEGITPAPDQVELSNGGVRYIYNSSSSSVNTKIIFNYKPNRIGIIRGEVRDGGKSNVAFRQVIYP